MEQVDITVIGAGIIGLSITERLSRSKENILLVEQEESFGRHTSSRNSEVIHSGIYYVNDSLKAKLCVTGNAMLYDFMKAEEIPHNNCGKFVIASTDEEVPIVEGIRDNGIRNGVAGLKMVDCDYVKQEEPLVHCLAALKVPSTGIMDVHALMKRLSFISEERGAIISYATRATSIERKNGLYQISFADGFQIASKIVINSGGLFADKVCEMAGIDLDSAGYHLSYNKGEYFKANKVRGMKHLIYPVPNPDGSSLGIHTRLHLDGTVSIGPNTFIVNEIDYSVDESHKDEFYDSAIRFMDINKKDLTPYDAGIRPQLKGRTELENDFIIREESDKGLPSFINLVGMESPGLTSCLAIAEAVEDIVDQLDAG